VRAFDTVSGLEEQNVDCAITVTLNAGGLDITNQPPAPVGLRAFATAGNGITVAWTKPATTGASEPSGFHLYTGTGGAPNYGAIAATVLSGAAVSGSFALNLTGFTSGVPYTIGVRAFNSIAEESNTHSVTVTANGVGPTAVQGLVGRATS
jgi:hypothetical protein